MSSLRPPDYSLSQAVAPAPVARDATAFLPRVEPGRVFGVLVRRSWVILLVAALAVAAMFFYVKRVPKVYQAKGSVYVSARVARVMETGAVAPEETRDLEQMRSVEQGLVSTTLLKRVIDAGGLAKEPDFAPGASTSQELLTVFSKRVKAELRRGTRLIDISVEDTDPDRAQRLVQSLVSEYEKWNAERHGDLTRQVADGISHEEETLRLRMEKSERALQEFRDAHPIPGVAGRNGPTVDDLGRLEAELTKVKAERLRLEAESQAFRNFDPAHPEAISAIAGGERAAGVLSLVRAVQEKEMAFAKVKERYLHKHPTYIEAANEVKSARESLAQTARSAGEAVNKNYQIASDNESKLVKEVAAARSTAVNSESLRAKFEVLEREATANRATHETVAARLRETSVAAAVPGPVLRWEDMPMVPEKAIKPRKAIMLGLAGIGGLFCGLMLAIGMEVTDGRIRDAAAAARATGVPLLASVASLQEGGNGDPVLLSQPGSETSESFRRLRATLSPPRGHGGTSTILFASAKPGEGRSFCAMNYAAALAMQGQRTLLLDADMRRPGLSRDHLQTGGGNVGLGDYLAGTAEAAKACHPTTLPNLYLLSSGAMQANASELLAGTRFPALLEDAFRWFDCVVIDTPPLLSTSDALAIARYADRVCMVVKEKSSDRRDLRRAADRVRSAGGNLIGFVWNEVPASMKNENPSGPTMPVVRTGLADSSSQLAVSVPPVRAYRSVNPVPSAVPAL